MRRRLYWASITCGSWTGTSIASRRWAFPWAPTCRFSCVATPLLPRALGKLTPVEPEEPWYVVLVPQVSVSTAEIFSDPLLTRNSPPIKVRPVPKGNSRNDCLAVVARRYPDVRNALNLLGKFTEAKLTGTGSCVFGGFPSKAEADKVSALLTETLTGFVAKGSNVSMLHRKLQDLL